MSDIELISAGRFRARKPVHWLSNLLRSALLRRLQAVQWGTIRVIENKECIATIGSENPDEPDVQLEVHDPAAWAYVTLGADIGAGQAYALGLWSTSDLCGALRIFIRNKSVLEDIESGWSHLSMPLYRSIHRARDNSLSGSQDNISAHYDLGNDFFSTFLDENRLYSSAVYTDETQTLEAAQIEKMDRICRHLELQPGQRILEIGSGWGGFACHAASEYGVQVKTITLSQEQLRHTQEIVAERGLQDSVHAQLIDYRDLPGDEFYDHIVSIEMIEAVGHRHMAGYLSTLNRVLKPGGQAMLQAITFPDRHFKRYLRMSDFVRHFIFPGGSLVSLQQLLEAASATTTLELVHVEEIGAHYARTLNEWHERFQKNRNDLPERYRNQEFLKLWEFYLQSCEACFLERTTGAVQIAFRKALD